jgi:hypothetical protein
LQAIERLAAELGPASLVVLEYHRGDTYANQDTLDLFLSYGVSGTPTIFFNRSTWLKGGGDVQVLYDTYKDEVAKARALSPALSPISISARSSNSSGVLTTNVTLTNTSSEPQFWLTLYGVAYRDLGTQTLRFVANDVTGSVSVPGLATGETASFKLTGVGSKMVVFLKSLSGEIIQVALAV